MKKNYEKLKKKSYEKNGFIGRFKNVPFKF